MLATLALAAPAAAAPASWPPAAGPGVLFAHFGEEHWDDADGLRILPRVVDDTARYKPALVTMSSDKSSNGTVENLARWKEIMAAYDRAGVPYMAGVGNHDREAKPGFPEGVDPSGDLANYMQVFADRPYPMGDAPPYADMRFEPRVRPADDPPGASSHYYVDYGNVRWVFLDNSCYSFVNCDPLQSPPLPDAEGNQTQMDFLRKRAGEANARNMLVFVVFHMPTQDDRPGHTEPTPGPHTMGEGSSPENGSFEALAAELGIDGVFMGHIKGQWQYVAQGVPYFTDGGAGGEVYVNEGGEVGVDTGYWHGYRLIRVDGGSVTTDAVPVFVPGGITVFGPGSLKPGETGGFSAAGRQPTQDGPKVEALELRAPDQSRPNARTLPEPARIWTSGNRFVLKPVAQEGDDPRRDPQTQTKSGNFTAACPGKTRVTVTSGWESTSLGVVVQRQPGKVARAIRRGAERVRRGRTATVALVTLRQAGEVRFRVVRRKRVVRTLAHDCFRPGTVRARWDGRDARGRRARRGTYTVEVRVGSDGRPTVRRYRLRLA